MSTRSTFVVIDEYVSADTLIREMCVGVALFKIAASSLEHDKNWAQSQSHYNTLNALISLGLPGTKLVDKNILF